MNPDFLHDHTVALCVYPDLNTSRQMKTNITNRFYFDNIRVVCNRICMVHVYYVYIVYKTKIISIDIM